MADPEKQSVIYESANLAFCQCSAVCCVAVTAQQPGRSKWVYPWTPVAGCNIPADARGNRIMDFSHAGYKGGGVTIPDVRVARTLKAADGDDTAPGFRPRSMRCHALAPDADGFRGAVLLEGGTYDVTGCFGLRRAGSCVAAAVRPRTAPIFASAGRRTDSSPER